MGIDLPPPQRSRMNNNYYEGRGEVTLACLHGSVGMTDAYNLAGYCARAGVSYHAACDNTELVYMVNRSDSAWHLRGGNLEADGLCLTTALGAWSGEDWFRDQADKMEIAAWWLSIICPDRGIDIIRCNHQNVRDALAGDRAAGGVIQHVDYTLATGDGTHTDVRGLDDPAPSRYDQTPMQWILRRAQQLAGYSDWQTRNTDRAPSPPEDDPQPPVDDHPSELPVYTVQPGDTLGAIVDRLRGITLDELVMVNDITNPDVISVGQRLVLPMGRSN